MKKQHLHTAIFLADHRDEERFGGRFREQIRQNAELAAFLEEANRGIPCYGNSSASIDYLIRW